MPQGGTSAGASQNAYQPPAQQLNAPPSYRTYEVRESLLELLPSACFVSRWVKLSGFIPIPRALWVS